MALLYGADAVYLAGESFGMRAAAGNFSEEGLREARRLCTAYNAKMYVTCNAILTNGEAGRLPAFLELLADIGADAIIAADLGVLSLAKKLAPAVQIHISTQAGVMNYESARAWHGLGASRVILARELSLPEIAEIRIKTPADLELEAFVHGAMCMSYSGRCLLSSYLTGRDANRGQCAQPCRWTYHLVESERPGEYMEISEENGTHILSARDLCMIRHLPELLDAGLSSLKIEGRMKSFYYVAIVTGAYRNALDAALRGEAPEQVWLDEVEKVSHREYSTGFFFGPDGGGQNAAEQGYIVSCDVVGVVEGPGNTPERYAVRQRNRFFRGDTLELVAPGMVPKSFVVGDMWDASGTLIEDAKHPMMMVDLPLAGEPVVGSILRKNK